MSRAGIIAVVFLCGTFATVSAQLGSPKGGIDDYLSGGEQPTQESSEFIWP